MTDINVLIEAYPATWEAARIAGALVLKPRDVVFWEMMELERSSRNPLRRLKYWWITRKGATL